MIYRLQFTRKLQCQYSNFDNSVFSWFLYCNLVTVLKKGAVIKKSYSKNTFEMRCLYCIFLLSKLCHFLKSMILLCLRIGRFHTGFSSQGDGVNNDTKLSTYLDIPELARAEKYLSFRHLEDSIYVTKKPNKFSCVSGAF